MTRFRAGGPHGGGRRARPRLRGWWGLGLALLAAGCAPGLHALREAPLPARARVGGVPVIVQARDQCGPASLAMVLAWAGLPASPEALGPRVFTPGRRGTLAMDLAREVRSRGLLAYRVGPDPADLLAEVAAGHPVLVLENRGLSWWPVYHYSVLVGYDRDRGEAVLHAGGEHPEAVRLPTLLRTWRRAGSFGLVVLPPGELPASRDPGGILRALADLEGAGAYAAAAAGYEAFLARWPGEWRAALGWGACLHALGDGAGAEQALRRARALAPGRPEPLNNLALVLAEAGRPEEAERLALEAVAAARRLGMDPAPYRDTLTRIRAGAGEGLRGPGPGGTRSGGRPPGKP